jgi:hypothetical protein
MPVRKIIVPPLTITLPESSSMQFIVRNVSASTVFVRGFGAGADMEILDHPRTLRPGDVITVSGLSWKRTGQAFAPVRSN